MLTLEKLRSVKQIPEKIEEAKTVISLSFAMAAAAMIVAFVALVIAEGRR